MADISKIQTLDGTTYDIKDNIARQNIPFGVTDSTSTSTAYTATVPGITALTNGTICYIMNNKVTSAANCTININDLGAKPLYMTNAAATRVTTQFATGYTWMLIYNTTRVDDGCWDLIYLYNSNTTYSTFAVLNPGTGGGFLADSTVYRYQFLFQIDDEKLTPLNNVSNSTGTSKAMLTDVEFDPFGFIGQYSTTTTIAKDARVPGDKINIKTTSSDLRYTFNCGSTLIEYKPFYLVVDILANGKAKLASSTPWAQELPSTNDGHYYIFLGRTLSTYQLSLYLEHPIYYHDGVQIKQYINPKTMIEIPTKVSDLTNDSGFITGMEILSYGSSTWNDFLAAYTAKKVVYCRASSNSNPASGSQTRLAFMAYVNNTDNPTSVEFQYYRSVSSHTDAQQGDQVYVYTLTSAGTWTVTVREAYTKIVAGTNMTSSYTNGTLTLNAAGGTEDALPLAGGTMEGNIDMDGNAVTGLPTPSANSDAVPKSYADEKYTKPSGGIPASDLASAVQTSLGLADSALQTVPSTYRTAAAQDTIDGDKQATLVSGQNIKTVNGQTILGSGDLSITGTLPTGGTSGQYLKKSSSTDFDTEWGTVEAPTKEAIGLGNVDNVQQYSASNPPPYPVTSVNGNTGAITVAVPTSVSELTNDSGYITGITSSDVTTALGYTPPTQDTTYESKAAASGGTAVSLVTTGEKYNWNTRGIPSGGSSGQVLKKSSATNYAVTWSNDSGKALHISKSSFSSLPQTISNSSITANMRVVNCVWGTPASITGNVTWTTAAGSLTLSGSISGSTTAEIDLIEF